MARIDPHTALCHAALADAGWRDANDALPNVI
jgi:hypothetical protein